MGAQMCSAEPGGADLARAVQQFMAANHVEEPAPMAATQQVSSTMHHLRNARFTECTADTAVQFMFSKYRGTPNQVARNGRDALPASRSLPDARVVGAAVLRSAHRIRVIAQDR